MKQMFLLTAIITLSACKTDVKDAQSVEYYLDHPKARKAMLDTCEVKNGSGLDADCVNAREALQEATSAKNREDLEKFFGDPSSEG